MSLSTIHAVRMDQQPGGVLPAVARRAIFNSELSSVLRLDAIPVSQTGEDR
jgi:hypothetical protein